MKTETKFLNEFFLDEKWLMPDGFSTKTEKLLLTLYLLILISHLLVIMPHTENRLFICALITILIISFMEFKWNQKVKMAYCISDQNLTKENLFFLIMNPIFLIALFLSVEILLLFSQENNLIMTILSFSLLSLLICVYLFNKYIINKTQFGKAEIVYIITIKTTEIIQSAIVNYSISLGNNDNKDAIIKEIFQKRAEFPPFILSPDMYEIKEIQHKPI